MIDYVLGKIDLSNFLTNIDIANNEILLKKYTDKISENNIYKTIGNELKDSNYEFGIIKHLIKKQRKIINKNLKYYNKDLENIALIRRKCNKDQFLIPNHDLNLNEMQDFRVYKDCVEEIKVNQLNYSINTESSLNNNMIKEKGQLIEICKNIISLR